MKKKTKKQVIKDEKGNVCKIYDLNYLANNELSEEDLYFIFDTASLIYSIVIGEMRYAGYDMKDADVIEMAKTQERWVYEHYWTEKVKKEFADLLTKVYKNMYQIKEDDARNQADWTIFQYGLTVKKQVKSKPTTGAKND